jgi:adenylate kinase
MCGKCGANYNLADIDLPASPTEPAVKMPPLLPPHGCAAFLEARSDDNFDTIKRRLEVGACGVHSGMRCSPAV